MSDGPHRSLPLKRNWKSVAERADNNSFGVAEIGNAIVPALADDCRDEMSSEFVDKLRGIVEEQGSLLIQDDIKERLDTLRTEAGSGIGRKVIENVVRISRAESAGLSVLIDATAAALSERAARRNRQIEEHYLRQSSAPRATNVRTRLEQAAANASFHLLARQVFKLDSSRPARSSAKQDGLDEGPNIQ